MSLARVTTVSPVAPLKPERQRVGSTYIIDDFFNRQQTSSQALPDPTMLLENLARCTIEVLAGVRQLDQLSRWLTDGVYQHLQRRVVMATRMRQLKREQVYRPTFKIGNVFSCHPADGVVEATVIVHNKCSVQAIAIRLEGLDNRWRATAIHVL